MDERNFLVSIACRLDNELIPTIENMMLMADDWSKIDVLVYNQDEESTMFKQTNFDSNVTLVNVNHIHTRNLSQARYIAQAFTKPSHEYYMCIDAHTRFDKGWDTIVKQAVDGYEGKCVITAYPPTYSHKDGKGNNDLHSFNKPLSISQFIQSGGAKIEEGIDYRKSLFAGGYHATKIDWLYDIGYDPYIDWQFHEIELSLRSYTHGYDIVNYKHTPLYHNYTHENRKKQQPILNNYHIHGGERIYGKIMKANMTFMEHKFPLGEERTLEQFDEEYGISLTDWLYLS